MSVNVVSILLMISTLFNANALTKSYHNSVLDMTLNNMMVRLQSSGVGEFWVPTSLSLFPGPLWLGVWVPDRLQSVSNRIVRCLTMFKQMTDVELLALVSNTWNHLTACKLLWIWIISSLIIQAIKAVHFRLSSRRVVRFLIE